MGKKSFESLIEQFARSRKIMTRELGKVIIGQSEVLDQIFAAIQVLRHRIGCNFAAAEGINAVHIIRQLITTIPEPEVPKYTAVE